MTRTVVRDGRVWKRVCNGYVGLFKLVILFDADCHGLWYNEMGNKNSLFCLESNFSKSKTVYADEQVTYASCHMKGNAWRTKDGASLWRTPVSTLTTFPAKTTTFSASSMDTEVHLVSTRTVGGSVRAASFFGGVVPGWSLQVGALRAGSDWHVQQDGLLDADWAW